MFHCYFSGGTFGNRSHCVENQARPIRKSSEEFSSANFTWFRDWVFGSEKNEETCVCLALTLALCSKRATRHFWWLRRYLWSRIPSLGQFEFKQDDRLHACRVSCSCVEMLEREKKLPPTNYWPSKLRAEWFVNVFVIFISHSALVVG